MPQMTQSDFLKKLREQAPELAPFDDAAIMDHVFKTRPDLKDMITPDAPKDFGGDKYKGPTTKMGGILDALNPMGGADSYKAGAKGALGFLKGATLDLPGNILNALTTSPYAAIKGIPAGMRSILDTTMKAGSNPEAYGRMMGNITGQPLVGEGVAATAGMMKPVAAPLVEGAGKIMRDYQPVSGMIPRIAEMRTMRNVERALGSKMADVGADWGTPTVQGEIVGPPTSGIKNARLVPKKELPASKTSFYGQPTQPEAATPSPSPVPPAPQEFIDSVLGNRRQPLGLPSGNDIFDMPASMSEDLGTQSPTAGSHMNSPAEAHNIPAEESGVPKTQSVSDTVDIKIVPKKTMSNVILKHMKDSGYEMIGVDEKGNFSFAPVQK